jgi:hypothetical protein
VTDGYGNQIEVDISNLLKDSAQVAENPNIASPPVRVEGDGEDVTTWEGVTVEEEEKEERE